MESKVEFRAVDMPYANKPSIHILAAVAEYEREAISEGLKPLSAQRRHVARSSAIHAGSLPLQRRGSTKPEQTRIRRDGDDKEEARCGS
jgi:hypothetical protein